MHGDRQVVLERQAAVARDVVGMGVRLEDAHEARLLLLRLAEVLLDCVGRVDDDRRPRGLVADQVGRAAEIVVDELAEEHETRGYSVYRPKCFAITMRWTSFVPSPISRIF